MHKEPKDFNISKRRRRFWIPHLSNTLSIGTGPRGKLQFRTPVPIKTKHNGEWRDKPKFKITQVYNLNTIHNTKIPYILTHTTALLKITHDYIITHHTPLVIIRFYLTDMSTSYNNSRVGIG